MIYKLNKYKILTLNNNNIIINIKIFMIEDDDNENIKINNINNKQQKIEKNISNNNNNNEEILDLENNSNNLKDLINSQIYKSYNNKNSLSFYFKNNDNNFRIPSIDIIKGIGVISLIIFLSQNILDNKKINFLSEWNNIKFFDFFPSIFYYVNGMCIFLTIEKRKKNKSKEYLIFLLFKKSLFLYLIGIFFNYFNYYTFNKNNKLFTKNSFKYLKLTTILLKPALLYLLIGILFIFNNILLFFFIFLCLVTYIYLMYFYKYENFNKENNYASYFDNKIFTYNHMTKPLDHFGIFNILNIIYISFNGFLILYFNKNIDFNQKILLLFILILIIINFLLFCLFYFIYGNIIIYSICSTSYMFLSTMICNAVYLIIFFLREILCVNAINNILNFFEIFGTNSLIIYIICEVLNFILYITKMNKIIMNKNFLSENIYKNNNNSINFINFLYIFCYFIVVGACALCFYIKKLYVII